MNSRHAAPKDSAAHAHAHAPARGQHARPHAFTQVLDRLRRGPGEHYVPRREPSPRRTETSVRPPDSYSALYRPAPCAWGLEGGFVPPAVPQAVPQAVPACPLAAPNGSAERPVRRRPRPFRLHDPLE